MNISNTQLANLLIEAEIINSQDRISDTGSRQFKKLTTSLNQILEGQQGSENLQTAIDAAPCTISWISRDLRYLGVNSALSKAAGLDASEFVGKPIGFLTGEDLFSQFAREMFKANADRLEKELEAHIDGDSRWYYMVGRKYQGGEQAVLIGLDITEAKAAQEAMIMQDKLAFIGTVSSSILHDIRNPLSVISLCCDAFADPSIEIDREGVIHKSQLMQKAVKRISTIITTFRNFAREGSQTSYSPYFVKEILQDAIELWKPLWAHSGIDLSISCPDDLMIHGSDVEISQVITNLIVNASQAIKGLEKPWIRIEAAANAGLAEICVTDSGPGVGDALAEKIFRPFFTTKPKGEGTGLGLAICSKIIARHQGTFELDRTAPNTRFVIRLPLATMQRKAS